MRRRTFALLPLLLTACLLGLETAAAPAGSGAHRLRDPEGSVTERIREMPLREADEVLWLARCIYSETSRPHEQRLVAWVVRNRVETGFRGTTYREAVLNPAQFSAFNRPSPRRRYILNLGLDSPSRAWKRALEIAYEVYTGSPDDRPFPITTRHFYSPVSMSPDRPPAWTRNHTPIPARELGVDSARFRFYDGIDRSADQLAARRTASSIRSSGDGPVDGPSEGENGLRRLRRLRERMRDRMNDVDIRRPRRPDVERPSLQE